jgi:DHA2 family methylenomycin A resistance protein-like MFS transporter
VVTLAPNREARTVRSVVLGVRCVGYFLVLLDVTVVNVALPQIGNGLGSGVAGLQWVVDGYALALAALLLAGGTIGDLRGHKRVVLTGLVVFGVASFGCAVAPNTGFLVAARVVQGVGAALLLPGTLAIITGSFHDDRARAHAIGIWAAVGSVALPAGPLLGGILVSGPGWRWVFALNVPIVAAAALVITRIVPSDSHLRGGTRRLDAAGTALGAASLALITFTVIHAGHDGLDVGTVVAAALAVLMVCAFVRVEYTSEHPMLPLQLFRRPAFSAANAVAASMNLGTLGLLFLLTLYLQTVQHRSAVLAGVALLPLFVPLSLLAPAAGRIVGRVGARPVMCTGLLLAAAGVGLVATWSADSAYVVLLPAMLCWGIGLALLTPAVVAAAVGAVPADRSGLASGVNNTARQAGGAIGIAVYGAVAGSPGDVGNFVSGLHATGLATTVLFGVAAVASIVFIGPRATRG